MDPQPMIEIYDFLPKDKDPSVEPENASKPQGYMRQCSFWPKRYAEAGMRAIGEPYKPGHIIFWNLRHTNGFPTLSSTPNTTMFAGFSPVLLNEFAQKGLEALQSETPFNQLKQQLANERYNILDFP